MPLYIWYSIYMGIFMLKLCIQIYQFVLIRDINDRLNTMPTAVPIDGVVQQLKDTMTRIEAQNDFISLYINLGVIVFLIYGNILYFGY